MNDATETAEAQRLRRLESLHLDDPALDATLDGFARIAARALGQPMALLGFAGTTHLTIRASAGFDPLTPPPVAWPLAHSPCAQVLKHGSRVLEVQDLRADPRFCLHPCTGDPWRIASYAGVALVLPGGDAIGTLCVANTLPGSMDPVRTRLLADLAQQVMDVLLLHEQRRNLEQEKRIQNAVDLTDLAPCGMYAMDAGGRVLQANAAWARMLDAPSEQALQGDGWMQFVHPDDLEHVQQARRAGLVDQRAYTYAFRTRPSPNVATRWIRSRVSPAGAGLEPIAFVGAAVDETHMRQVEDELRAKSRLLETILQNLPCGVTVLDDQHRPVLSNESARLLLEDPRAIFEVNTPELVPVARRISAAAEIRSVDMPAQATGASDPPLAVVHGASLPGGGMVATFTDVTSARKVADQLRTSDERLESALEAAAISLWELDERHETLYLEAATAALFGLGGADTVLSEKDFLRRLSASAQRELKGGLRDLLAGRADRVRIRYPVERPDGQRTWILTYAKVSSHAADGSVAKIVGTCKDVSEVVQGEERLKAAVLAAENANRAKSDFLATMSHEIRTPLNGVIGLAKLLSAAELPPLERKSVEMLRGCSRTLLSVLDNILDISKIEAGHLSLEEVPTELEQLVAEMGDISRVRAVDKGIAFELEAQPDLPRWIRADPTRVRQILLNLLGNALKFTDQGSVRLKVCTSRTDAGERLRFEVHDTGIGIAEHAQRQLFTRFTQVDSSTTRRFGGTGLGLAISRQLAQMMGGDISLQSSEGCGSTFIVDIPLRRAAEPARPRVASGGALRPDARILVAEDNEVNQHVIHRMLSMLGYENITLVGDGEQVLRACEQQSHDLILMDCQMPVLDGKEATRRLRRRGVATTVIALTATATDQDRQSCLEAGMDDYLAKPIELPVLGEKVQRWLAQAAPPAQRGKPVLAAEGSAAFNPTALERYFLGDPEFFAHSRQVFVRSTPASLEELRQSVGSRDDGAIKRICHRLKAASGTLGGERLVALCEQFEAGRVPPDRVTHWFSEVGDAFDAFVRESDTVVARSTT